MATDLSGITLARGSHPLEDQDCGDPERCLFEWYNWLTRQAQTDDRPPGVSRVLHRVGISLNDRLPDDKRQALKIYLPNGTSPLEGTATDGKDRTRAYIATDWAVRTVLPQWLDLAGLTDDATTLRGLARIDTAELAREARAVTRPIREKCWATRTAALDKIRKNSVAAAVAADADAADADADADAAARRSTWDTVYAAARTAADAKLAPVTARLQDSAVEFYAVLVTGEWPA